jgi:hypothetical protein
MEILIIMFLAIYDWFVRIVIHKPKRLVHDKRKILSETDIYDLTKMKPTLKCEKSVVFEVNSFDFGDFISKVHNLSRRWYFAADQEAGNDTQHTFEVLTVEPLDEYDRDEITKFYGRGKGNFMTHTLLQDAVNRGLIEPGKYLINVS